MKKHKELELKDDCLQFDQDISEIAVAYINNLIADHTPKNLHNIARDGNKLVPIPPELNKDEFYTKETLTEAIMGVYNHLCGGDHDRLQAMLEALLSQCEGIIPFDLEVVIEEDQECYVLAT